MSFSSTKPFVITSSDVSFMLGQLDFPSIHVIGYDKNGKEIYGYTDAAGHEVVLGLAGTFDPLTADPAYTSARVSDGIRNVNGEMNNLTNAGTSGWGSANQDFLRLVPADYAHYVQPLAATSPVAYYAIKVGATTAGADYSNPLAAVVDYTPRMISQTTSSSMTSDAIDADLATVQSLAASATTIAAATQDVLQNGSAMDVARLNGMTAEDFTFTATDGTTHTETFVRNVNSVALDPSLSGWNTLFGQFFDHGLDFIQKPGTNVTIKIQLAKDDPLYRAPDYAHGDPGNTSITINRATVDTASTATSTQGAMYQNTDTPYIDQNQTYGGTSQITDLLREWVIDPNTGQYRPGAALLDGHKTVAYNSQYFDDAGNGQTTRTLPTLDELRAALAATGRDDLTWEDIANYRLRDAAGHVLDVDPTTGGTQVGYTGQAVILDMNPRVDASHVNAATVDAVNAAFGTHFSDTFGGTGQLDNLSLGAMIMNGWLNPATFGINDFVTNPDGSFVLDSSGNKIAITDAQHAAIGEVMLEAIGDHYVGGDGRVNENFGLTAIHHIFHEDHNIQLVNLENSILEVKDTAVRNGYQEAVASTGTITNGLDANGHAVNADGKLVDASGNFVFYDDAGQHVSWDQDKLFQGAKLIVEMEYQHVAIDQYARRITPDLPEFVTYDSNINANVSLEYAQAAFRFGHSQLRESIDTLDPNGQVNGLIQHYLLKDAFLNPTDFAQTGAGAIASGMIRQVSSEIDEFVTPALQQTLLGQSLDLAAINIARGRDLGLPTLNETRKAMYDALQAERLQYGDSGPHAKIQLDLLKAYSSWNEFGAGLAHPESLVNFIAAYSFDGDRAHAQAVLDADATGQTQHYSSTFTGADGVSHTVSGDVTAQDAAMFMAGAKNPAGSYVEAGADGFDKVDLWLGGLAEAHVLGGALGPTFNAIFEDQMERLMDGDRFYYLYRLNLALPDQINLGDAVTTEQFKDIIERTTGAQYLSGDVMSHADSYVNLGQALAAGQLLRTSEGAVVTDADGNPVVATDANAHEYGDVLPAFALAHNNYGVYSTFGRGIGANGSSITVATPDGTSHTYLLDQRPNSPDTSSNGNPTYGYNSHEVLVGSDYNDYIDSGDGDDTLYGGAGNDILIGNGGGDHIYGGDGNDLMFGGGGTAGADVEDFMDGGAGDDVMYGGANNGAVEVMIGGDGNDRIYEESGIAEAHGGRGDDYIDTGSDTDLAFAGEGNDYLYGGEGPDELHGETGDDVLDGGTGTDKLLGGEGDDIFFGGIGGGAANGDSDELIGDSTTNGGTTIDTGFDIADYSDLTGKLDVAADLNNQGQIAGAGATPLEPFNQLWQDLNGIVGSRFDDQFTPSTADPTGAGLIGDGNGDWLVGGSGNDALQGNGGNDVIVGGSIRVDQLIGKYLLNGVADPYTADVDGASHHADPNSVLTGGVLSGGALVDANGNPLFDKHFTDLIQSTQFKDFLLGDDPTDTNASAGNDTAVFRNNFANYTVQVVDAAGNATSDPNKAFGVLIKDSTVGATSDGNDLVVGVDNFKFADKTVAFADFFNHHGVGTLDFTGASNATTATLTAAGAITDLDSATATNPTGLVSGVTYQWQASTNGGSTWTNAAAGAALTLGQTPGTLVHYTASYTDLAGHAESLTSPDWNVVIGTGTNNTLAPAAGVTANTVLFGLAGADTINGGAGNDRLYGGAGNDALNGGAGNDTAYFTGAVGTFNFALGTAAGSLQVAGTGTSATSDGTDTLTNVENLSFANGTYALVQGTAVADTLTATDAASLVLGFAGNDTLNGGAGADWIDGGAGNDRLTGGGGDDTVKGGAGTDTFVASLMPTGNDGNDTYDGSGGTSDTYDTSAMTQAVTANLATGTAIGAQIGNDTLINIVNLTGGAGNDVLTGNSTANTLIGSAGNDTLTGSGGADTLIGGTGTDTFVATVNDGNDRYDGTGGSGDTLDMSQITAAVNANLATGTATGNQIGTDALINIFNLTGGSGNDTLTGDGNTNVLIGGAGNDLLSGGGGNDMLDGAAGIDTAAYGGAIGTYVFALSGTGGLTVSGTGASLSDGTDTLSNIENLTFAGTTYALVQGSTGTDTLTATNAASLILAFDGNDTIIGGSGADYILAGTGNDRITAGGGSDIVFGGGGTDTFFATTNDGNDRYDGTGGVGGTYDMSAIAAAVNANLLAGSATGSQIGNDTLINIANLTGGAGNDTLTGDANANVLIGGGGNDSITGGGGNDTIDGGTGIDTAFYAGAIGAYLLSGGAGGAMTVTGTGTSAGDGTDTLTNLEKLAFGTTTYTLNQGTAGADVLTAAAGSEILIGGAGIDTFRYNSTAAAGNDATSAAHASDLILDFVTSMANPTTHDVLDLSTMDANTAVANNQTFIWDATSSTTDNFVRGHAGYRYYTDGSGVQHTIVEGNTSVAASGHDFQIDLVGHLVLTTTGGAADLIL